MCSNSRGGDLECSASVLRKQKRQRIPKRGPGVAELEKILREQENKDVTDKRVISPFASSPKNFIFSKDHNNNFSMPLPPAVTGIFGAGTGNDNANVSVSASSQLAGTPDSGGSGRIFPENHLTAPPPPRLTNGGGGANTNCTCNCNSKLDSGGGGRMAGSTVILPENHHFRHFHPATTFYNSTGNVRINSQSMPRTWDSGQRTVDLDRPKTVSDPQFLVNLSDHNQVLHSPHMLQKKYCQSQNAMMNHFPNPTLSSPSTSGFYQHHVEPPSNQRSYQNHTSSLQEENINMVGIKRQMPFPPSIPPPPPPALHGQFPSFPSQMQRIDPSILAGHHIAFSVGTTSTSRDRFQSSNMDHTTRKANANYGTSNGKNGIIFGASPTTISSTMQNRQQEFFKVKPSSSQELVKDKETYEGPRACQGSEGSSSRKPFYRFLQSEEEIGATETRLSLHERRETRKDIIDLNLKL